ncbi:MAG: SAM-dependent methyltransferase, partial [Actinomycetota bacterium]
MSAPRITVVGLGPGGRDHVTTETLAAIERITRRHLRTSVHPTAHLVSDAPGGAITHDDVYESADTFDEVYRQIVDRLVGDAADHDEILYAVPGSPMVLEQTVEHLRRRAADGQIELVTLPAMSFLDVAWARLGVDPVDSNVTLVDGHAFTEAAAGVHGPLLVAHVHADWVLSEIKLARDEGALDADGSDPITVLQRLGTPDERVVTTTWDQLDR